MQRSGVRSARRGLPSVLVAVAFFGLAGVLGKMTGLSAPLIVLGRVVYAGAALGVLAGLRRLPLRPRARRDGAVLVGQGLLLALHWTAFFQSINVSSVAIGLLAVSTFPLFTAGLEPLLLRQRPSTVQLVAALAVLPGIYLLTPVVSLRSADTLGVLWGLLAGATFALLSVTNRWLGRSYPSVVISLYQDGVAIVALAPALWLVTSADRAALLQPRTELLLALLGLGCTALAHTLFIEGMRSTTAQLASLLASGEPVWGILFALVLLREAPSGHTLLGGVIILGATSLPVLARLRTPRTTIADVAG